MEQEDAKILFKDLSARTPYYPMVSVAHWEPNRGLPYTSDPKTWFKLVWEKEELTPFLLDDIYQQGIWEYIKPYLRSLSSMTEEEKKEYEKVCELDTEILAKHPMNGEPFPALYNSIDWLNKNHFDYRNLIEKGLALVAPEGMYN